MVQQSRHGAKGAPCRVRWPGQENGGGVAVGRCLFFSGESMGKFQENGELPSGNLT